MSTGELILILLAAAGIPLVINVLLLVVIIKSKGKKKKGMDNLTTRLLETKDSQEALFEEYFEKIGYDKAKIGAEKEKLSKERLQMVGNLLEGILNDDDERLGETCDDLNVFISSLLSYEVIIPEPEVNSELSEEVVEELRADNKRLKKEVHKTLKTLNNIFAEFSSMFGEETESGDLSAEEILEAMESFSKKVTEEQTEEASGDVVVSDEDAAAEMLAEQGDGEEDPDATTWADAFEESGEQLEEEPSWDDAFNEENDK